MYNRLRLYISVCLYYSGFVHLARWCAQHSHPRLTILYYHQTSKVNLRSHWQYVCRHYRVLPLEEALAELYMTHKKGVRRKDRRPLLALTLDDGYYDNYTHAFPLACELQLPMTIFLIPGYMESGRSFWWIDRFIQYARVEQATFEGHIYNLADQEECKTLAQAIDARYTLFASPGEQAKFLASLYTTLDVPPTLVLEEEPVSLLTWEQVQEMQGSGLVSFGAHTMYHPDLASLLDPDEVEREVGESRMALEERLGHPVHSFAYPFGNTGEYGPQAVKQAGYDWAVTVRSGVNTRRSDPHLLKRRNMDGANHWLMVAGGIADIWEISTRLKSIIRRILFFKRAALQRLLRRKVDRRI